MANGNNIVLVGNITRDPELRFTPTGQATATFGLAVNRRWQNRQTQEWEEATSFFDVVCWREMAENASESLGPGLAGDRDRSSRAAVVGDPGRRQAVQGRGRGGRDRPQPAVGDRAGDQERAPRPGRSRSPPGWRCRRRRRAATGRQAAGGVATASTRNRSEPWRAPPNERPAAVPRRPAAAHHGRSRARCAGTRWSGSTTRTSRCCAGT